MAVQVVETKVGIPQNKVPNWMMLMSEPLNEVKERVLKSGVVLDRDIDEAVLEYRKFMGLVLLGYGKLGMANPLVDEVWHTHILFTRDYSRFCGNVFGGFIHHNPITPTRPDDGSSTQRFVDAYTQVYGDLAPVWRYSAAQKCFLDPPMCEEGTGCTQSECSTDDGDDKKK
jgi:hypothetical protein